LRSASRAGRVADIAEPFGRVSGHRIAPTRSIRAADLPEHDWKAARERIYPLLMPAGTAGVPSDRLPQAPHSAHQPGAPIVSAGPCGLVVTYGIQAAGYDVLVNPDHLLGWGVPFKKLQEAALRNLADWSGKTGWTDESSGERRLLSSDSGEGYDASRILLDEVREYLVGELHGEASSDGARILVGVPDRHLLVAGTLAADDAEFLELFREFVAEQAEAANEPVDRRVLEIADGQLVEFSA
jgi:hypothetical protein